MQTGELLQALGVSQPTLSRTIQETHAAVLFRVAGVRTPYYGLRRELPSQVASHQTVYQIDPNGTCVPWGSVDLLTGGATFLMEGAAGSRPRGQLYEGLPPAMHFAAPSGFLGRQVARGVAAALRLPESLRDWSDDHHAAYLFTHGWNLPGDRVFGDAALQQVLAHRRQAPIRAAAKLQAYVDLASGLRDAAVGSSAGGEQPKFLATTEDRGAVIVKFARLGSRMAELLRLEHLALQALAQAGVPAARTQVLEAGGCVFLESERFDRVGPHGRRGVISAGALDDELFGQRDSWSMFAERCVAQRMLTREEAGRIHVMAAFSELIGNTDRHFENVSLMLDARSHRVAGVAPAYDILPMKYAPIGGDIDPQLHPIEPRLGPIGGRTQVWRQAFDAARRFYDSIQSPPPGLKLSRAMKDVSRENLRVALRFVEPLI